MPAGRRRWIRLPVTLYERHAELNGSFAANAVTLIGFVALFPLLLLIVSVTGLVTGPDPGQVDRLVDALGLTGGAAETVSTTLQRARASGVTGSVVGSVGVIWSALSLVGALRYAVNLPRSVRVSTLRSRLLAIPWLAGAVVIFAVSFGLSALLNWLPVWTVPIGIVVGFGVDLSLFVWTFWFLDRERPSPRLVLPGAVAAAIGFGVLKTVGTLVVPRLVEDSSSTYGAFGTVFAILAWLLILSRVLVYSVVLNDVWHTPDTDDGTDPGSGPHDAPAPERPDTAATVDGEAEPDGAGGRDRSDAGEATKHA